MPRPRNSVGECLLYTEMVGCSNQSGGTKGIEMKISEEDLRERLYGYEGDPGHVETTSWKWGHSEHHVFKIDGEYWGIWVDVHSQEGIQLYGEETLTKVKPVRELTTNWVPVNES